ncbi:MAG TPA: hypothetical protein VHE32_07180, partial [Rhodanobacteraceae bacterium]|nr:hypothetical protein [Rhodanobacteraceae bacterium]
MNRASFDAARVWLAAGAAAACLAALLGALILVGGRGLAGFWPSRVVELHLADGARVLGEAVADDGTTLIL